MGVSRQEHRSAGGGVAGRSLRGPARGVQRTVSTSRRSIRSMGGRGAGSGDLGRLPELDGRLVRGGGGGVLRVRPGNQRERGCAGSCSS